MKQEELNILSGTDRQMILDTGEAMALNIISKYEKSPGPECFWCGALPEDDHPHEYGCTLLTARYHLALQDKTQDN